VSATDGRRARRARLLRYGAYQLLDVARDRGIGSLLALGFIAYAAWTAATVDGAAAAVTAELAFGVARSAVGAMSVVIIVLMTSGVVANERKAAYTRFLFAKPVSPLAYWLQAWGAAFTVALAFAALFCGAVGILIHPFDPVPLLAPFAAQFVMYGGLMFLVSAITNFDLLAFGIPVVLAQAWPVAIAPRLGAAAEWPQWLLPPVSRLEALEYAFAEARVAAGLPVPWDAVAHVVGYGAGCLLLGLVILRRRSLVS
jgi:hypothetical protein